MGELVDLRAERALRELAELCRQRPDIGDAIQAAAAAEGVESMGDDLDFLTVQTAAERLHVKHGTIRQWIRDGKLPAFHAGGRILLRPVDVAAMVQPVRPSAALPDDGGDDGK